MQINTYKTKEMILGSINLPPLLTSSGAIQVTLTQTCPGSHTLIVSPQKLEALFFEAA